MGPMRCARHDVYVGVWEEARQMVSEIGAEVLVVLAERERDRHVQRGEPSGRDSVVLGVEVGEQGSGPCSNGRQRIRAVGAGEELRKDRHRLDAVGVPPTCQS